MRVSIIIPAYNASKYIEHTLKSVFKQTYPKDQIEIIVVNDGSTDNTLAILEEYKPQIKVVSISNGGVSRARNIGLQHATGSFIQYLDSDDLLTDDKIERQITALTTKNADVAYGNWERFTQMNNGVLNVTEYVRKEMNNTPVIEILGGFWCPPAAILYSRSIVEKIGPWKEWLPIIEDARYFFDAGMVGAKFIYTDFKAALYRQHINGSLSTNSKIEFERNIFKNISDIYRLWKDKELKQPVYKYTLEELHFYNLLALQSLSKQYFNEAITHFKDSFPNYIPQNYFYRVLTNLLGVKKGIIAGNYLSRIHSKIPFLKKKIR